MTLENATQKARELNARVVLPEADDDRMVAAARRMYELV